MRRWGIRQKVLVVGLVPTIATTVLLGLFFTHSWVGNISKLLDERGASLSRQLASAVEYGMFTGNRNLLFGLASSMLDERDVRSITLLDASGQELLHTGPRLGISIPASLRKLRSTTETDGEDSSIYISPVRLQDLMLDSVMDLDSRQQSPSASKAPLGWTVVELSHAATDTERYRALLVSLLLVGGGILFNLLIAMRMSRSVTDPIFKLTHAVQRLKEGHLDTRVYTQAGPELVQLESGLNAMAEELSKAHAEMQQNVDQATEDLRETLETIEIQNIELDLARKEALEASRIKSEFLANMSHEIRTPLNGIIGFTDLLLKSPLSQQQRDHLHTIRKSSEILLTIINDLLDFSKIEAGKLVLDRIPFRLRDIVEDVMVMLAPAAHTKNLDLVPLVYSDVPDHIVGDPLRVKQIITNLVNNAIKFTQTGEVVMRAMLDDEGDDEHLTIRISVTDTGVGLSRAQQQSLFNAFTQGDASTARQFGGTGLGLVISKRLVEEMGGEIGLESELGKGSTFWFTLKTDLAPGGGLPECRDGIGSERVIYLEHQKTTGLSVEHQLSQWGLEVTRVATPSEMLDKVAAAQSQHNGYAAALVGLTRHLLNSNQYRDLLHQLEVELDCRVILLTPTLDHHDVGLVDMASFHLVKPIYRDRLYDALFQLVHGTTPQTDTGPATTGESQHHQTVGVPKVLAVDDNDANLKLVLTLLEDLNIRSEGAASGFEALSKIRQQRFDLVFMDVQMPGMDGIETTRRIRGLDGPGRHTPIVALTAHALSEERDRLLRRGFDDYLTKPLSSDKLTEIVQRYTGFRKKTGHIRDTGIETPLPVRPSSRARQAPCVDIEESIRLAAGKADLAEELFSMLLEQLLAERNLIADLLEQEDWPTLLEHVHKLHGATRYCGVPELRQISEETESALKRSDENVAALTKQLLEAIDHVEHWCDKTHWQSLFRNADSALPS
ncbi:response regulator [Mangrovitalea sediminis]|uniref:response regulator n=1 Tax=Mangrovitalea sediminis TaxID=1982043 RepID=UPI000BE57EC8|nr:response regulator [Mangrovitalea sediminis]